jgi:NAD+ kinase
VPILLRSRLRCTLEESSEEKSPQDKYERLTLNEIVINRGPSPYLSNLDIYVNEYLITTVQGDGLIISTPTGSTAYAMAAGASMSHPSVPCVI